MHFPSRAWVKLEFVATVVFSYLGLSPTHAQSLPSPPDISECHSDTPWVGECLPLRRGETLALIVDVTDRSKELRALDASSVEEVAVQVLSEGLQAPAVGREHPRADVKITSQSVDDLATFAWAPDNPEATMTVLLQCSIEDAATAATAIVACQMTRGRMKIEAGWMTGYQDHSAEPSVALLAGHADADLVTLWALLQQVFRKTIYISRLGR
jgi:hypothetical protein